MCKTGENIFLWVGGEDDCKRSDKWALVYQEFHDDPICFADFLSAYSGNLAMPLCTLMHILARESIIFEKKHLSLKTS